MSNPGLLKKIDGDGYPGEFLVARLHGKSGGLFRNWEFLTAGDNPVELLRDTIFYRFLMTGNPDGAWHFLNHEYAWVYLRLDRRLRRIFEPYFVFWESNILVQTIRHIHNRKAEEGIARQLENSLLDQDIQMILKSGRDLQTVLERLEACFVAKAGILNGLKAAYGKHGILSLETFLREAVLSYVICRCSNPLLMTFFRHIVDFYNCMTLARNIRWEMMEAPSFIGGGTIEVEKLQRASLRKDMASIAKIFPVRSPDEEIDSPVELERKLLSLITKLLRRLSRGRTVAGEILFYLWEQYRYTRNISLVLSTMPLRDETAREGLVA